MSSSPCYLIIAVADCNRRGIKLPAELTYCLRALALLACLLSAGCESIGYYWQAGTGHMALMNKRQPIDEVLAADTLDEQAAARLEQLLVLRTYAEQTLKLEVDNSYNKLVVLDSPYVSWSVVAAPPLSLEPKQWCFPVAGCVSYRGYFNEDDALEFAARQRQLGLDVYVGGISAYSTLGWFDDPVLSPWLALDDYRLAALLFHELAHRRFYLKGDTQFNESFASTVEELAVYQWLRDSGQRDNFARYQHDQASKAAFIGWLLGHRQVLERLYASDLPEAEKLAAKEAHWTSMREDFARFEASKGGSQPYARWVYSELNNAKLSSIGSYTDWVPAFKQLFFSQACDWSAFFEAVEQLAQQDQPARQLSLSELQNQYTPGQACAGWESK